MNLPFLVALDPNATVTTRRMKESITTFIHSIFDIISQTPLPFETYPEDIYTTPLIREHHDSYLYYIEIHSLTQDVNTTPYSIVFNTPHSVYNKHPSNIFIPISQFSLLLLTKLDELNNITDEPTFLPSAIHALQSKDSYFEVPNLEQLRSIENNPQYWLEPDLLQLTLLQTLSRSILSQYHPQ